MIATLVWWMSEWVNSSFIGYLTIFYSFIVYITFNGRIIVNNELGRIQKWLWPCLEGLVESQSR
jgi:hypothetical protein